MPASIEQIVNSANAEWNHWGNSTWDVAKKNAKINKRDDDPKFAQYVIDKYCSVGGGSPTLLDIQNDDYAWSAVGMSAIMKNAGYTKKEFKFAESHSTFIRNFVKARVTKDENASFWAYRLNEAGGAPAVGDIVGYVRGKGLTHEKAQKYYDVQSSYKSHTDVVVAVRATEIDVIGANVLDSVTKKTLLINSLGHIIDKDHFWFVTLKRRQA